MKNIPLVAAVLAVSNTLAVGQAIRPVAAFGQAYDVTAVNLGVEYVPHQRVGFGTSLGIPFQPYRIPEREYSTFPQYVPWRFYAYAWAMDTREIRLGPYVDGITNSRRPFGTDPPYDTQRALALACAIAPPRRLLPAGFDLRVLVGLLDYFSVEDDSGYAFTVIQGRFEMMATYQLLRKRTFTR